MKTANSMAATTARMKWKDESPRLNLVYLSTTSDIFTYKSRESVNVVVVVLVIVVVAVVVVEVVVVAVFAVAAIVFAVPDVFFPTLQTECLAAIWQIL